MNESIRLKIKSLGFGRKVHLSVRVNRIFTLQLMSFRDEAPKSNS